MNLSVTQFFITITETQSQLCKVDISILHTIYRREHSKRIELINWILENMKKPDIQICDLIESRMNEIIL